jgi:hypothetical protein
VTLTEEEKERVEEIRQWAGSFQPPMSVDHHVNFLLSLIGRRTELPADIEAELSPLRRWAEATTYSISSAYVTQLIAVVEQLSVVIFDQRQESALYEAGKRDGQRELVAVYDRLTEATGVIHDGSRRRLG